MFTGIIEEVGTVKSISASDNGAVLTVVCKKITEGVKLGDSIAVNGACQTVISFSNNEFTVEVSKETMDVTNFSDYKAGTRVNLERAMSANGRFDGHMVSGHIDGMGVFLKRVKEGLADRYFFSAPDSIMDYVVYKGSISINGISLTIASVEGNQFSIAVIPHTAKETTLFDLSAGERVNLESDMIARYIEKFIARNDNKSSNISVSYLEEHGFM